MKALFVMCPFILLLFKSVVIRSLPLFIHMKQKPFDVDFIQNSDLARTNNPTFMKLINYSVYDICYYHEIAIPRVGFTTIKSDI